METNPLFEAAKDLAANNITVIPVRADGTKAPALAAWQKHQTSDQDLDHWFGGTDPRYKALGVVTGPASGNLELVEIEGPYVDRVAELTDLAANSGLDELWTRLNTGWLEQSPSGGLHWFYRVEADHPIGGNTKLAQDKNRKTIAETRGKGGQVVAAPSSGEAHETGKGWTRLIGGPATMPLLTADEREAFHTLIGTLDEREYEPVPAAMTGVLGAATTSTQFGGSTPGDDFESKTSWADILTPHGWSVAGKHGQTTYWTRPGKKFGISASTGRAADRDRLFVFSSNADPFPDFEPITKFYAYTLLNHGGDATAAAKQLRREGFGEPVRPAVAPVATSGKVVQLHKGPTPIVASADATSSNTAIVLDLGANQSGSLGLTDDSNALEFVAQHGKNVRFHSERSRWLVWDGARWAPQPGTGGLARELAKATARGLAEDSPDGREKTLRHKRYSLSDRGLNALLGLARTDPAITITTDDLDAHPWELNTPGGIVNLATGELSPPDPDKLHTRSTTVTPDPAADSSVWDAFLEQTLPDPQIRGYVQRLIGYSAIGEVRDHVLPFAHGSGGNGKTVLLEAVQKVLGSYAGVAPAGFLMAKPHEQHATELADLAGRRFVICSEVNERDRFDEAKVKSLTGGDTVKARYMRQDFFEFTPTHHLWLMGNHKPGVDSGGDGFWRRLRLIPFEHKVADEDKIEDFQTILATEHGPAVLQWIVDGAVAYKAMGLNEPADVKAQTEEYQATTDLVGQFLEDRCLYGPEYSAQTSRIADVRAAYEDWCKGLGVHPLGGRAFTNHLASHGVLTGRNAPRGDGSARLYGAIMLKPNQQQIDPYGGDRGGW